MRNDLMIIILTLLIGLVMFSCNQTKDKQEQGSPDSTLVVMSKETILHKKLTEVFQKPDFNVAKFINLTDSLLTEIKGKSINLSYEIDTIIVDKTKHRSFFTSHFQSDSTLIKRYSFDPGKGNRILRIWIIIATFKDSAMTNLAFASLKKDAYDTEDSEDWSPGLTYTNDYVIKSENKIYWLNSGCVYAFYNHKKLKDNMLQSLQIDAIQDSIWCRCGQVKCSLGD